MAWPDTHLCQITLFNKTCSRDYVVRDSGVEIIIIMIRQGELISLRENDRGTYVTHEDQGTYI